MWLCPVTWIPWQALFSALCWIEEISIIPSIKVNYEMSNCLPNQTDVPHSHVTNIDLIIYTKLMCSHTISQYANVHLRTSRCSSFSVERLHLGLAVQVVGARNASWEGDPGRWQRNRWVNINVVHKSYTTIHILCVWYFDVFWLSLSWLLLAKKEWFCGASVYHMAWWM